MQYDVISPNEYIEALDNDWRKETLNAVRKMILSHDLILEEGIEYKMLCYRLDGHSIFHLNAQKAYVSLYVGDIGKVHQSNELLKPFDTGKGCIRIKKSVNLEDTALNEFIIRTIDIWRKGGETDC